jgi:hypothetical protein
MTAITTTANLVDLAELDEVGQITTTLERGELEAVLSTGEAARLWFELGVGGEEEPQRLTVALSDDDVRALLAGSTGDDLVLALDAAELADMLEEPDVEAHGIRGALAVSLAVATTAIAAPTALAATPQSLGTSSLKPAVTSQQVGAAAATQVSRQVARQQIARGASAKSQRSSPATFKSLTIIRAGILR